MDDERRFPVIGTDGCSVPWALVEPYREQATRNHGQTLERLAERGGLDWMELFALASGSSVNDMFSWTRKV